MEITEVKDKKLLRQFISFPYKLYKNDPNYIPDLILNQKKIFSNTNPFFEHSQALLFMALENKKVMGRIAAIHNRIHNNIYNEKTAFFGFLEAVSRDDVFIALIGKVSEWAKSEGLNKLVGPTNFTTNDSCGFLISGFDRMPVINMPYNKDYYAGFFDRHGFTKELDLFAYEHTAQNLKMHIDEKLLHRVGEKLFSEGISLRQVHFKDMDAEIMKLREVYNASNIGNSGFIPLSENEFKSTAKDLKTLIPEKLILFAEKNDETVGFIVALPDYNQVFRHIHSGRLFPFGIFKFLWHKRKIDNARVLILGVLPKYRGKGIDLHLYYRIQQNLASIGIHRGEAAYIMESNTVMNSIMQKIGGKLVKKYRMFSKEI